MALAKQTVPIAFGGGLDTKTDPASVPMGKWLTLENCVFSKPNSLHKRNGYTSLGTGILTGGSMTVGQMIEHRNSELLLGDATNLYSYDQANASWVSKGALPNATLDVMAQVSDSYSLTQYDTALHSGGLQIIVAARLGGGGADSGLVYAVVDSTTGQQVVPLTQIDAAANLPQQPKVCVLGGYFFIVWRRTSGTQTLVAQAIAVTAPQTLVYGSPQAVTSGVGTSAFTASGLGWDLTVSNGEVYIVFPNASGTTTIFGITAVATYTLTHSVVVAGTAPDRLCICGNPFNNDVVVGMIPTAGTTMVAFAYNSTLVTQTLAPTTLDTQASGFVAITALGTSALTTNIQFFATWATGASESDASFIRVASLGAAYAAGAVVTIGRQLKVCGKPVLAGGVVYLPAMTTGLSIASGLDQSLQNSWFLINTSGQPLASAFAGDGAGYHQFGFSTALADTLPETVLDSSGRIVAPVGAVTSQALTSAGLPITQTVAVALVRVTLAPATQFTRAQLGDVLLLSGALPRMYDGAEVVEQGFLTFPEIVSITHAAGGSLSAGTYQYAPVFEWWDAAGQIHRSAAGPAFSVTVLANEKATVTVSTLRLTQKSNVLISLYRTTAGGTLFHRVTNNSASAVFLNDPTVATVAFVDTLDDAAALAQPELYTDGGGLQAQPPPALLGVVAHGNRVFGIDPTTGQINHTKQYIPGSTGQPIEFSGFLTLSLDTRGGKPTALASLDEKLIVFKADRMFMVVGDGPDSTGAGSNFSAALFVSSDTGCTNPKSIVTVPNGLMFQSPKGIYLLGRDLSLSYIGAPVESFTSAANVTSAQLIPSANQVRFSLDTGSTVLVYDYYVGQWSVFTGIAAADATIWGGKYTYLTAAGVVNQESTAFADPGNTFIRIRAVSPWVQLGQIQGFQRIYELLLLGTYASAHSLIVKMAYDFAATFAQTDTVPVASDPAPLQFRFHCAKQKCGAIQISIEDASTGTIGESLSLSGLMLEAGIKGGPFRLPAAKSYG